MTINKLQDGARLTMEIEGKIDTTTSPELESEIKESIEGLSELIIDLKNVTYISSAGLRVLLAAHKTLMKQGKMTLINVSSDILDMFDVTGFSGFLNIE